MKMIQQQFEGHQLRMIEKDSQPWFVLADVCTALGLADTNKVAARLDADEKGGSLFPTPGGLQEMTVVNESGLYAAILRSNKAEAKRFRKWITNEVLPSLRQKGSYTITPTPAADFGELERLAGLTVRAIGAVKAEIRAEVSAEIDEKIGSFPIDSGQIRKVKDFIAAIQSRRAALGLGRSHFGQVYADAWRACGVGNLASMTREQFPRVVAYLDAELGALTAMSRTGLFSEGQAAQS